MFPRTITDGIVTLGHMTLDTYLKYPKWLDDEEVARFLGRYRVIPTEDQQRERFSKTALSQEDHVWEIRYKKQVVGITGIHQIDLVDGWGITGIMLGDKTVWNKGLATKVMLLRARYAFEELNMFALETHIFEANIGSLKATEKCGYEVCGKKADRHYRGGTRWTIIEKILRKDHFYELHNNK